MSERPKPPQIPEEELKDRFRFVTSIRFELIYALATLTHERTRIHEEWKRRALKSLPRDLSDSIHDLGWSSAWWTLVAD